MISNVKRQRKRLTAEILTALALLCGCANSISAQEVSNASTAGPSTGSLSELVGKRRAFLVVKRAAVIDARGGDVGAIEEALRSEPRDTRRHRLAFATIARKLNKFMKKYRSISAASSVEDADFVVFFNLLEYRWPLGTPYPYGELFVIVKPPPGGRVGPHVIWKSQKVEWAGDAVDKLVSDLRLIRWE